MEPIIQEFCSVCKIDCGSRDERGVADYMKAQLEQLGCTVVEDDAAQKVGGNTGNLVARLPGTLPKTLLLSSHMDRVRGGRQVNPIIEGDTIRSDGTTILGADNVSGLVVILDALRRLKASEEPHCNLEVVLSVCEEDGILGARMFDSSVLQAKSCIVLDSTGPLGQIDLKRPYKAMIDVTVHGVRAHGGSPEKGVNAITAACNMLSGIREGRLDEETTSNLGVIHGGQTEPGTVCDCVTLRCEVRSYSKEKLDNYLNYFEQHCRSGIADSPAILNYQSQLIHGNCIFEPDHPLVQLCSSQMEEMGIAPILSQTMEGCDGNVFATAGINCLSIGMGNANAHGLDETASVSGLIQSGALLHQIITAYSNRVDVN